MKTAKNILSTFILPLLMLTMQQCDESTPKPKPLTELEKLPPATQSGKHTFGCLVDGKAWVTKLAGDSQSDYQGGLLSVFASVHNDNFNSVMDFTIHDLNLSEISYPLDEMVFEGKFARYFDYSQSCGFVTTSVHTGSVTITHMDKSKYIISGTFEFEVYSSACNKVIKITDGRFDIHYAP